AWQYWDGDLWRDFRPLDPGDDGTVGLTRSGTVRVHSDCAQAKPTAVGGVTSCWLRAVLAGPLPPDGSRVLPQIDRVQLHTVLERRIATSGKGGLLPDNAFAGGAKLDVTKPFQPFGAAPGPDASFVFACEEAFSRPGAAVTIGIDRPYTAQELNDIKLLHYEMGVNEAKALLDQIRTLAASLDALWKALVDPATGDLRADLTLLFDVDVVEDWYTDLHRRIADAYQATSGVTVAAQSLQGSAAFLMGLSVAHDASHLDPTGISETATAFALADVASIPLAVIGASIALIVVALAEVAKNLSSGDSNREAHLASLQGDLSAVSGAVDTLTNPGSNDAARAGAAVTIVAKLVAAAGNYATVVTELSGWPTTIFLSATQPSFFQTARDRYAEARRRIDDARTAIEGALGSAGSLVDLLDRLTPEIAAAAAGVLKPKLREPTLAWEYWDGSAWKALHLSGVDAAGHSSEGPRNLRHGRGRVMFTAPADWETTKVNNTDGRWVRVRIKKGAFAIVKLVSWFDAQAKATRYLAVTEPRPPLLDVFSIGYHWESAPAAPQHCLTLNDFRWADRTEEARWHGNAFTPFSPTDDIVPTLYLGFDRPLPADLIGLFADIAEVSGETAGPPLEWESWDVDGWSRVAVEDET
ncbi:MAG TPA: hypothetical protein VF327_13215, partial [Gaiellaceae bacterium]